MPTSQHYKRYAVQCLDVARSTSGERERAFIVEMAQVWQRLAEQAAAAEQLQSVPVDHKPDRGD
jgi:hypothetical protein